MPGAIQPRSPNPRLSAVGKRGLTSRPTKGLKAKVPLEMNTIDGSRTRARSPSAIASSSSDNEIANLGHVFHRKSNALATKP